MQLYGLGSSVSSQASPQTWDVSYLPVPPGYGALWQRMVPSQRQKPEGSCLRVPLSSRGGPTCALRPLHIPAEGLAEEEGEWYLGGEVGG